MMPTWNKIHIEKQGSWLYRVEDERYWEAELPGVGKWSNERWWKIKPKQHQGRMLGNTGGSVRNDRYIAGLDLPGFARSGEHTYEIQSLMRNSYADFCLKKKK